MEAGGKFIVVLNTEDAEDLGVRGLSRLKIVNEKKKKNRKG